MYFSTQQNPKLSPEVSNKKPSMYTTNYATTATDQKRYMFSHQYKPHNIALPRFIPRAKTHTEIKTRKEKFSGGGNYPFF